MPSSPAAADIQIRLATSADLPTINDIYNHYVLHSTCTYQDEPETIESRRAWFDNHGDRFPITVAVDGTGGILGWASLSPFHRRSAYRFTVENSVYLRHDVHRRGIGRMLTEDLISRAKELGYRSILALIDADQAGSIELHRKLGFTEVAHLKEVGFKFGRWLDVIYLQRML